MEPAAVRRIGVVVAIAVAVVALPIYGVRRQVDRARTAEARARLPELASAAVAAFGKRGRLCRSAPSPVPREMSKEWRLRCSPPDDRYHGDAFYQSMTTEWRSDSDDDGFRCLGWEMTMPQYYQYRYTATGDSFTVRARGCAPSMRSFAIDGRVEGARLVVGDLREVDWNEPLEGAP